MAQWAPGLTQTRRPLARRAARPAVSARTAPYRQRRRRTGEPPSPLCPPSPPDLSCLRTARGSLAPNNLPTALHARSWDNYHGDRSPWGSQPGSRRQSSSFAADSTPSSSQRPRRRSHPALPPHEMCRPQSSSRRRYNAPTLQSSNAPPRAAAHLSGRAVLAPRPAIALAPAPPSRPLTSAAGRPRCPRAIPQRP